MKMPLVQKFLPKPPRILLWVNRKYKWNDQFYHYRHAEQASLIAFFRGAKKSSNANLYECLCWCLCIVLLILFYGGEFTV